MVEYKIPQDAQWGDIDIMERSLDFTGETLLGRRQGSSNDPDRHVGLQHRGR
jgi:hypothetical protein